MTSDSVILALEQQVSCYRRLVRFAEAQHEHVQQSRMEPLLEVLRGRQEVLEELTRLEQTIGPAKKRWQEFLGELNGEQRKRAEAIMSETRRLLEQITASDRNDALVLQQRKLNLGKQISQASAAKQINKTYAASAYGARRATMDLQR